MVYLNYSMTIVSSHLIWISANLFLSSVNSSSSMGSTSTKYDPDLLKMDVEDAQNRVARLKRELEQIRTEMQYKQQGLETLAQ